MSAQAAPRLGVEHSVESCDSEVVGSEQTRKKRTRGNQRRRRRSKTTAAQAIAITEQAFGKDSWTDAEDVDLEYGTKSGAKQEELTAALDSVSASASARQDQRTHANAPDSAAAVLDTLRGIGLSVQEIRKIIRVRPRLLDLNATTDMLPVLDYLADDMGLTPKQVRSVVRFASQVFWHHPDREFPERIEFLERVAGIPTRLIPSVIARRPHVLWMDLKPAAVIVNIVLDACPLIEPDRLGSILARAPQALVASPVDIASNLDYLAARTGSRGALPRVLSKIPLALVFSEKTMEKRITYLRDSLGLSDAAIGKAIIANPDVLQWSIESRLEGAVRSIADIVGRDAVRDVVQKVPGVLGCVDSMQSRVSWLEDVVGLSNDEIRAVVKQAPAVLMYSISGNLAPKWSFIHKTLNATKEDVIRAPREIFCANLQQRAMPRYAFIKTNGSSDGATASVAELLSGSDAEFCKAVARCDSAEYRRFVEDGRYLLFFSQLV